MKEAKIKCPNCKCAITVRMKTESDARALEDANSLFSAADEMFAAIDRAFAKIFKRKPAS